MAPMLQDLDSLAARIGQMVQFTRQLQSERSALQARLKNVDQERDALRDQLQRQEHDFSVAADRLAQYESQSQSLQSQTQAQMSALQHDLEKYKAQCESMEQQLVASQSDSAKLRAVADKARENIDSILMRLPGAAQE